MMRASLLRLLVACVTLLAAGCANGPNLPPKTREAHAAGPVILISIDGLRADYLDRGRTPNLSRLARGGVRAAMRPSYPSLTFPNHYTLVTGLRPDQHGVVDNVMRDPRRPGVVFTLADRSQTTDAFWWDEAEPLWVTAERAGVRTATMFWPGSEAPIQGVRPHDWVAYDRAMPAQARVDQVLAWLDRPAAERPRFITLYFDEVDTWGHNGGPDSPELNAALERTDAAVGRLITGLQARGLGRAADVIVVADHGMASTSPDRVVVLDDLVPAGAFQTTALGPIAGVFPAAHRQAEVEAGLLRSHPHMACWRKADIPARLHYGRNARVPPVDCLAETGWLIETRAQLDAHPVKPGGAHGYDPADPMMSAAFVAAGPDFRPGAKLPAFDNVEVYSLLARLIGVSPRANDGTLETWGAILRH